jgi:hypothetical protein
MTVRDGGDALGARVRDILVTNTSDDTWCEVGRHFTCSEAEALAEAFDLLGANAVADALMYCHALSDDEPDDLHAPPVKWSEEWAIEGDDHGIEWCQPCRRWLGVDHVVEHQAVDILARDPLEGPWMTGAFRKTIFETPGSVEPPAPPLTDV